MIFHFLQKIIGAFLDCLFPLSKEEKDILSLPTVEILKQLRKAPPVPIQGAFSLFAYKDKIVRKIIWNIKYNKSKKALDIASLALYHFLYKYSKKDQSHKKKIIVPIPMTPKRLRERGFNQCLLLLHAIKEWDKENIFLYEEDLLLRIQHKTRQTLKNRKERLASTKGIFIVNEKILRKLKAENNLQYEIIVIDDVITTGSTMQTALTVLKQANFKDVFGLSIAH